MNKIRQVNLSDIPALQELYQHTVLTVNRKDYTAEEVADWASCGDDTRGAFLTALDNLIHGTASTEPA